MGTAYWQQRQTTVRAQQSGGDQQKQPGQAVMKIFPIFFGFISFSLPAGLVVYFAASQMFRIGQQALILNMDDSKEDEKGEAAGKSKPAPSSKKAPPKKPPSKGASSSSRKPSPKKKTESPRSATPRPAARRPQGSKKRRGKKRKRR
jgi:YidC/Oxa1 family membrane protein insertase